MKRKTWLIFCCFMAASTVSYSSPFSPKKYFQLDLKLEINQKPYDVMFNWHCAEELEGPNFGPGGIIKKRWVIYPNILVIRKFENDSAFIFKPPLTCGEGGAAVTNFYPPIAFIRTVQNPSLIEVFDQHKSQGIDYQVNIKSGVIRQLEKSAPDYIVSEEEKRLMNTLQANIQEYQSVSARVLPESVWGKSEKLNQYFLNAEGIVIAPTPSKLRSDIVGSDGRNNFFPVSQKEIYPLDDPYLYTVPLAKVGNIWAPQINSNSNSAKIYYALNSSETKGVKQHYSIGYPPIASVDYDGTSIQVLSSQQIFDSKRRLLIQFINTYIPMNMTGLALVLN